MRTWQSLAPTLVAAVAVLDPFAFFRPTVQLEPADLTTLSNGAAIARTVSAPSGNVGIAAAVPIQIDGARLIAWMHDIAALKRSRFVREIGRFSATPVVGDLERLTLDEEDLDDIAHCRLSDCDVKLRPAEIIRLRTLAEGAGRSKAARDEAVQRGFRELLVQRATVYLASGMDGPEPPAFLATNWPEVAQEAREFPRGLRAGAESFLYWSKDAYAGKPIISITHVMMLRGTQPGEPEVLVIARQLFATHYTDGAWSFTALVRGDSGAYLVYVNQSAIDLLGTWYGGLVRRTVERRLRQEAVDVIQGLRRRMEGGDPPSPPLS